MVAWMLYVTAVGTVLSMAAVLAEGGLRALGRPVRWAWAAALAGTVMLPAATAAVGEPGAGAWSGVPSAGDNLILLTWVAVATMLLANLRLSDWTLRRNARSWRPVEREGRPLLVTAGFGPGVVGAARPRIVLPEWVLAEDRGLRRLIVAHEAEHVRAGDTRLLLGGSVLVALVPWCLPLWWQLHRLRGAIEADCDARVLDGEVHPRDYANVLVTIAGRPTRSRYPVPALAPGGSELERRIRHITAGRTGRSFRAGISLLAATAATIFGLTLLPPAPPPPTLGARVAAPTWDVGEAPTEVRVILSIEPEPLEGSGD